MPKELPRPRGRPIAPEASHRRVAEDLRRRIRGGDLKPGTTLPSWRALARAYRVGVRVIDLACEALKRDGLLVRSPRRRLVTCDDVSPGAGPERQVLLVMTSMTHLWLGAPISDGLLLGIVSGAGEVGAPLFLAHDSRLRTNLPTELLERPLLGVVVAGKIAPQALRAYERISAPVVLADHPGGAWKVHASGVDNEWAMRESFRRLRALGHRYVAFLRRMHMAGVYDVEPDSRERQSVYEALMRDEAGAAVKVFSFFPADTHDSPGLRALVRAVPPVTAVIASDAYAVELVLQAARHAGLAVPRDLSVIGLEALSPTAAGVSGPRFDFRVIGREAVKLLAGPRLPPRHLKCPGVWNEGATLAPPRVRQA